jgi:ribosomal protein S18 acetylase RimI-like enzyme
MAINGDNNHNHFSMEIKNLKDTPVKDIVQAISESFADYFVPLSSEVAYWEQRFKGARVNLELSFGMFDKDKLVGFIINGIDNSNGFKTAFNTGTGVTEAARGHGVTDNLYHYAMPVFKEHGVQCCSLEVIEQNARAIHVYERIGFNISKRLKCFKGTIAHSDEKVTVQEIPFSAIEQGSLAVDKFYSWDNTSTAIKASGDIYKSYKVTDENGTDAGFFILNPSSGHVIQFEPTSDHPLKASQLLAGVSSVADVVKINNVDTHRPYIISSFLKAGLENFIDQYEMHMTLA